MFDFEDLSPRQRMLMAMGAGLMGTRGAAGFGRAGLMGLQEFETAKRQKMAEEELRQRDQERRSIEAMRAMQMQQMQAAMADEQRKRAQVEQIQQAARNNMMGPAGIAMMGGGGPSVQNAETMSQLSPTARSFNEQGFADEVMGIDPLTGLRMREEMRGRNAPMKMGRDDVLVDPTTRKTVWEGPGQQNDVERAAERLYGKGTPQYQQYMNQWLMKQGTHAPQPSVNLQVNTERTLYGNLAEGVAKQVISQRDAAFDAATSIDTAHNIKRAIDSGKAIVGTFGSQRLTLAQIGQQLGFTGDEAVVQTRAVIQGLAKLALAGRGQLKGQGQVSDFEGKVLARAETGDFDTMTAPEIRALADVAERSARIRIEANTRNARLLTGDRSGGAAPIIPYFDVPMPKPYQPAMPQIPGAPPTQDFSLGLDYLERARGQ